MNYLKELREKANIKKQQTEKPQLASITGATCYEPYGLKENMIIFYHTTSCPYCVNMIPIVKELEAEGYEFYWADAMKQEATVVRECYAGVLSGGVPEFICAGTSDYIIGAMSKERLKGLADKCKS